MVARPSFAKMASILTVAPRNLIRVQFQLTPAVECLSLVVFEVSGLLKPNLDFTREYFRATSLPSIMLGPIVKMEPLSVV